MITVASRRARPAYRAVRLSAPAVRTSASASNSQDVRNELQRRLKESMKVCTEYLLFIARNYHNDPTLALQSKDSFTSTALRGVLSEVYSVDKSDPTGKAKPSAVMAILRKAASTRREAAEEYQKASRNDLAEHESKEAQLFDSFLPAMMTESQIDALVKELLSTREPSSSPLNPKKIMGETIKDFYSMVDKSLVDGSLLQRRILALIGEQS